jgi:hypothetical protein
LVLVARRCLGVCFDESVRIMVTNSYQ